MTVDTSIHKVSVVNNYKKSHKQTTWKVSKQWNYVWTIILFSIFIFIPEITSEVSPSNVAWSLKEGKATLHQNNGLVIVGLLDGRLYAYDIWAGQLKWSQEFSNKPLLQPSNIIKYQRKEETNVSLVSYSQNDERQQVAIQDGYQCIYMPSLDGYIYEIPHANFERSIEIREEQYHLKSQKNINAYQTSPLRIPDIVFSSIPTEFKSAYLDYNKRHIMLGEKKTFLTKIELENNIRNNHVCSAMDNIDQDLYIGRTDYEIRGISEGKERWEVSISDLFIYFQNGQQCTTQEYLESDDTYQLDFPIIDFNTTADYTSYVSAFNRRTGDLLWQWKIPGVVASAHGIELSKGKVIYEKKITSFHPSRFSLHDTNMLMKSGGFPHPITDSFVAKQHRLLPSPSPKPVLDVHSRTSGNQLKNLAHTYDPNLYCKATKPQDDVNNLSEAEFCANVGGIFSVDNAADRYTDDIKVASNPLGCCTRDTYPWEEVNVLPPANRRRRITKDGMFITWRQLLYLLALLTVLLIATLIFILRRWRGFGFRFLSKFAANSVQDKESVIDEVAEPLEEETLQRHSDPLLRKNAAIVTFKDDGARKESSYFSRDESGSSSRLTFNDEVGSVSMQRSLSLSDISFRSLPSIYSSFKGNSFSNVYKKRSKLSPIQIHESTEEREENKSASNCLSSSSETISPVTNVSGSDCSSVASYEVERQQSAPPSREHTSPLKVSKLPPKRPPAITSLPFVLCTSRYDKEFEELSQLGQGGYGIVVLAKNRLDGIKYAIKRVNVRIGGKPEKTIQKLLREVKILALLDHPNIVRYYQAWLEEIVGDNNLSTVPSVSQRKSESNILLSVDKTSESVALFNKTNSPYHYSRSGSIQDDGFEWESPSTTNLKSSVIKNYMTGSELTKGTLSEASTMSQPDYWLYIQMQYCPKRSLLDFLENPKRQVSIPHILRIIYQIASALDHVHSCGLIHRDLKPSNILIMDESIETIKLADFGLSRHVDNSESSNKCERNNEAWAKTRAPMSSHHFFESTDNTVGVGTYLYCSPEQAQNKHYNSSTDIYSLGLILFEMTHERFSTNMERVHSLQNARNRKFSAQYKEFITSKDTFSKDMETSSLLVFIYRMLDLDGDNRPTAKEVITWCEHAIGRRIGRDETPLLGTSPPLPMISSPTTIRSYFHPRSGSNDLTERTTICIEASGNGNEMLIQISQIIKENWPLLKILQCGVQLDNSTTLQVLNFTLKVSETDSSIKALLHEINALEEVLHVSIIREGNENR